MPQLMALLWIALTILLAIVAIRLCNLLWPPGASTEDEHRHVQRQMIKLAIALLAMIMTVILLPIEPGLRGQLLALLGLGVSAIIALSSTTFIANVMAGVMLRAVGNFRPGDFIRVEEHFGRVSERGLFHVEIQTPDRDLITLPNLFLVNQPVRVIHSTGTMISATVSIGYDVHHEKVESCLVQAAELAELSDGYVRITDLLDHAVVYRLAGFLAEPKRILLAQSRLREAMLDVLHRAGIEIVSPARVDYRKIDASLVLPEDVPREQQARADKAPDELIFDKAEQAAELDALKARREEIQKNLSGKQAGGETSAPSDTSRAALEAELASIEGEMEKRAAAPAETGSGETRGL